MTRVDPLALPSVSYERRGRLPGVPALYFLIEEDREVIYIGQSVNLQSRWVNHHCAEGLERRQDARFADFGRRLEECFAASSGAKKDASRNSRAG